MSPTTTPITPVAGPPAAPPARGLLIRHEGMGWPVGAVVPPAAFPHGYHGHLTLGAVAEVGRPPTHGAGLEGVLAAPQPADLAAAQGENARLRTRLAEAEARAAGLAADLTAERAAAAKLREEVAELTQLLEQATATAGVAAGAAEQARRAAPAHAAA